MEESNVKLPKKVIMIMTLFVIYIMISSSISFAANNNTFTFSNNGIIAQDNTASGFEVDNTSLTINESGTYTITGICNEGNIKVKNGTKGVTLVLKDLSLSCSSTAPISLNKTAETTIEVQGKVNLTDKEDITTEDTNADFEGACIKVKSGAFLNIKGNGTLIIDGNDCKNGIKGGATSKIIIDGNIDFNISVANSGLASDGSMIINGGTFNVTAEDAIKCDPDDDDTESLGDLTINGGNFIIKASSDGVRGNGKLEINGGTFDITAEEGLEATYVLINDGIISINASDDGINASSKSPRYTPKVEINGGNITIIMNKGDTDAIDSNGELIVTGGTINITGQSAFDYDTNVTFTGGDILVNGQQITTISNSMIRGGRIQDGLKNGGRNGMQEDILPISSNEFKQGRGRTNMQFDKMLDFQNQPQWTKASNWAIDELNQARENDLIPDLLLDSDLTLFATRKEFAHIIVNLYEALTNQKISSIINNPFKDTNDSEVLKAYSLNITNGTSNDSFSPDAQITREQMATMFTRTLAKAGIDTYVDLENISKFDDDEKMHNWGRSAIYFMSNNEIIKGVGNNLFNVDGTATREQALLISKRIANYFSK